MMADEATDVVSDEKKKTPKDPNKRWSRSYRRTYKNERHFKHQSAPFSGKRYVGDKQSLVDNSAGISTDRISNSGNRKDLVSPLTEETLNNSPRPTISGGSDYPDFSVDQLNRPKSSSAKKKLKSDVDRSNPKNKHLCGMQQPSGQDRRQNRITDEKETEKKKDEEKEKHTLNLISSDLDTFVEVENKSKSSCSKKQEQKLYQRQTRVKDTQRRNNKEKLDYEKQTLDKCKQDTLLEDNDKSMYNMKLLSGSNRRRNRITAEKRAKNKEMLDNIISCVSLMEKKLSKYEINDELLHGVQEKNDPNYIPSAKDKTKDGFCNDMENTGVKCHENTKEKSVGSKQSKTRNSTEKKKKKKKNIDLSLNKPNSSHQQDDSGNNNLEEVNTEKNMSKDVRFHATHFLAVRLYNQDTLVRAASVQETILKSNQDLKPSIIDLSFLHITLAVMSLKNKNEMDHTLKALTSVMHKLNDIYNKYACKFIEFECLGTFNNGKVVFMAVKNTEGLELLKSMVSILKDSLVEQNISIQREMFTPHVTLMKLRNKLCFRKKGIKRISADMYSAHKNDNFGKDEIVEILLCSMARDKDSKFYKILASIDLKNDKLISTPALYYSKYKDKEEECVKEIISEIIWQIEKDELCEVIEELVNEIVCKI